MSFVHLHTHTQYSLLDGSNRVKEYVKRVKDLGMNAAAITDHGAMFGVIEFYKEAKKQGINPIIGCEVYVATGSRFERETQSGEGRYYHLVLLAENNIGYDNLKNIVSIGYLDGFYYKPRVDFETLEKYHEGIICLSACLAGEVARNIGVGNYEEAKAVALKYRDCFGENNYFLEMQDHGISVQKDVNAGILRLSQETGIPLVVTNDCHYTYEKDAKSHDVLLCIQTGKKLSDTDRMRYEGGQYFVKSEEEMERLFPYAREALDNTQKIADRCHVEIIFGERKLPHYDVPEGYTPFEYLQEICYKGLKKRYEETPEDEYQKIKSKLDFELNTIESMGFVDYFLIVWDFINYAKTNGIPVGPGRGSAAGSLVAYSTGITDIDPERHQLLFERFLNPERVSMPDIDIDFCINRRGNVIDYVKEKYGENCVSQIITMGTLKPRNAIRDVGRVMEHPYDFVSNIANKIPRELYITIESALIKNPELKELYDSDENVRAIIDTAKELEGLPRNIGTHAAGVVITQTPSINYIPLAIAGEKKSDEKVVVTQFEKDTVEELGLLKMDFLGLRNLTIIDDALNLIKETQGIELDLSKIPFDDPAVFSLISSGKTEGVFQLESPGMINFMKELKPESLDDIIAGIALYRPGPMQFIGQYIQGKKDKASITYDCKELEPILAPTYGCIVYQEQVMQIVRDLAGYSLGRSDILRRAMSKKKADVMAKEKNIFLNGDEETNVPGCIKNGIDPKAASAIYDKMLDFAEYAFNKSHAASYAVITYQTAYLKTYYPKEYFAALLTSVLGNTEDVAKYIASAKEMGIKIMPPNINTSESLFTVKDNKIYYGMSAIKSVGSGVVEAIVTERNRNGEYKSLIDFMDRIAKLKKTSDTGKVVGVVNKNAIKSLILSGALDDFPGNRHQKIVIYEDLLKSSVDRSKDDVSGQLTLFDMSDDKNKETLSVPMPDIEEYEKWELLKNEKSVMGIYVSGHPLDNYTKRLSEKITATSDMFKAEVNLDDEEEEFTLDSNPVENTEMLENNRLYVVGGIITKVNMKYTKNNQAMAFVTIEDTKGSIEVIVFPKPYERCKHLLDEDNIVFITGRASIEADKDSKLICDNMQLIPNKDPGKLFIRFENIDFFEAKKDELLGIIKSNLGEDEIIIYINDSKTRMGLSKLKVNANEDLIKDLRDRFGVKNVEFVG